MSPSGGLRLIWGLGAGAWGSRGREEPGPQGTVPGRAAQDSALSRQPQPHPILCILERNPSVMVRDCSICLQHLFKHISGKEADNKPRPGGWAGGAADEDSCRGGCFPVGWGRKPGLCLKASKKGLCLGQPSPGPRGGRPAGAPSPCGFRMASLWASVARAHGEGTPGTHVRAVTPPLCWLWGSGDPLGVSLVFCSLWGGREQRLQTTWHLIGGKLVGAGWGALGHGPQSQAASEKGGKGPRASPSVQVGLLKVRLLIPPGCTLGQDPRQLPPVCFLHDILHIIVEE